MPRVIHFEVHVDNPQRAMAFYMKTFGWKFKRWGTEMEYWTIQTLPPSDPGINGGMIKRAGPKGMGIQTFICTIDVPDLEEYVGKVMINGGLIMKPKMPIPGIGWMAYAKDTEGNVFGMLQEDPSAQ